MVPVWSALIGAVAALVGVWVTQWLTNRREFQRDQLKWAQERQQRELDSQKAAMTEAMLAHTVWLAEISDLISHLKDPRQPKPDLDRLADRENEALRSFVVVELVVSDDVAEAARDALFRLAVLHRDVWKALAEVEARRIDDPGFSHTELNLTGTYKLMWSMASQYRSELARLSVEPVVLPQKPRRWLRLPWRKSA
jgi:hypothetical protein